MGTIALIKLLHRHSLRVFTTADILTLTGMSATAVTQTLRRLAEEGLVIRIKRGIWVNQLIPDFNPYEAIAYLASPWPAYVSLYSALTDYGIVEEIPQVVYAISSGRPKRIQTPIGKFHIHHLPQQLIWGYELKRAGQRSYPIAEPEKAFLDLVYLALVPRSPIQFPYQREGGWNLDKGKLTRYASRFKSKPLSNWLKVADWRKGSRL